MGAGEASCGGAGEASCPGAGEPSCVGAGEASWAGGGGGSLLTRAFTFLLSSPVEEEDTGAEVKEEEPEPVLGGSQV